MRVGSPAVCFFTYDDLRHYVVVHAKSENDVSQVLKHMFSTDLGDLLMFSLIVWSDTETQPTICILSFMFKELLWYSGLNGFRCITLE